MGNSKVIGINVESKSLDHENDRAHSQNKSAITSREKVALRSEAKYSLDRNAQDAERGWTEKLKSSDSAEGVVTSSPINMIKGDIKITSKETNWDTSDLSKDFCDQQFMEWIKLRGDDPRPRNKMRELSKAQKLKCWNWSDNELFLDQVPDHNLNDTESTDRFEPTSTDFLSYVDSDSCFKDAKPYERDVGSFSYLSELSTAERPNSRVRTGSVSPSAFWHQEVSSDESVKHLYCFSNGNGFEKGLLKHTECKESAHRIEFKPSFSPSSTQLGGSGKKSGSPKILRQQNPMID